MIIYWFMFFSCTLIAYFSQRRRVKIPNALGETVYKPNVALAIMSAIPLVFFVGVRGYMADTTAYIKSFEDMNTEFIKDVLKNPGEYKDIGFKIFTYLVKSVIDNYTVWLFIIAIFCVACIWICFYKHSDSFTFSVFLYFGTTAFAWLFNGMRQYIAVSALFLMFPLVIKTGDRKKDFWRFVLFILFDLFLATFHFSALIAIPLFFLCRGRLFGRLHMLAIAIITIGSTMVDPVVNFVNEVFGDTQYSGVIEDMNYAEGSNVIRLIVACVPVFLAVYRLRRVKEMNDPTFNFCLNMSLFNVCLMVPATIISGNQFARIAEYCNMFNLLLYPMVVDRLYAGKVNKLLKIAIVAVYVFWFYYQMDVTSGGEYSSRIIGTFS